MNAERKPIPGYEDRYEIDTTGQVYAMFRFKGLPAGRKIGSYTDRLGYVKTWLSQNGKTKQITVHRLLMLTFYPIDNPQEMEVNHIDGNPSNNSLSNLEWVTHQANIQHAHKVLDAWAANGPKGETTITAKLTDEKVRQIRALRQAGETFVALGKRFGVSNTAIRDVIIGRSWGHVK